MNQKVSYHQIFKAAGGLQLASVKHRGKKKNPDQEASEKNCYERARKREKKRKLLRVRVLSQ